MITGLLYSSLFPQVDENYEFDLPGLYQGSIHFLKSNSTNAM
jgi:hypothetical protein